MTGADGREEGAYERILGELIEALDQGRAPALVEVIRAHPGEEQAAGRAFGDFDRYRQLRAALPRLGLDASGASAPIEPGERLGDFEVVGLLAQGGMSMVYRARQLSLGGREVALKVMPSGSGRGSGRFQREALTLAGLHHAHLAEVYGFGEVGGRLFLAMKLVEGPTLHAVLERLHARGRRPDRAEQRRIVSWIEETAAALGVVHASGLVHRDVKPSNIVIDDRLRRSGPVLETAEDHLPEGAAVLVDFGLVRPTDPELATLTLGSPATPSYAPPEQLLGGNVTPAADVFALGVTLHDLLAGRLPGERPRASAGLEPLEELTEIDRDLAAVVARAADPDARWRYSDAAELRADLAAWLVGRPVVARRPPIAERARRSLQRNPWLAVGGLAGLIAMLVIALAIYASFDMVAGARAAKMALESGDVRGLRDGLERVPAALDRVLLEPEVRAAAASVRAADTSPVQGVQAASTASAIGLVLAALDENDRNRALFKAAEHLRQAAHAEQQLEPLVATYFAGEIERAADALRLGSWRNEDTLHERALLLAARLLYEIDRESENFPDAPWRADLREPLLEIYGLLPAKGEQGFAQTRRYVVSALSGCGLVGDLPLLMPLAREGDLEERRLALQAMERIVRRANQAGDASDLTPELAARTWEVCREPVLASLAGATTDRESTLILESASQLLLAQLLARRRAPAIRDEPILTELLASALSSPLPGLFFLAAGGNPQLPSVAPRSPVVESLGWRKIGRALGLHGDRALIDLVRQSAGGAAEDDEIAAGLAQGLAEARGFLPEEALDYETLLGGPGWKDALANPRFAATFRHDSFPILVHDHVHLHPTDPLAFWDFDLEPLYGGTARPHVATNWVAQNDGSNGYLKLWSFGRSTVQLPFAFSISEADVLRRLFLAHQLPRRAYFPFQGEAFIEVHLNGQSLGTLRCGRREGEEAGINLPQDVLRDGLNLITLRLTEDTTTTYRLYEAWVE